MTIVSALHSLSAHMPPVLVLAGFGAGLINAIAGGGPVLTLGVMSLIGFDPRLANLTSTVALSPGQLYAGWAARHQFADSGRKKAATLGIGLIGGAAGAWLLLATSPGSFRNLVPWLILFATAIYALSGRGLSKWLPSPLGRGWGWGFHTNAQPPPQPLPSGEGLSGPDLTHNAINPALIIALFVLMAIYGGYFGGGNSFLVLALIASLGFGPHVAASMKNGLIAAINLGAVLVFAPSGLVDWQAALALGIGGIAGSFCGVRLLGRISAGLLRALVIAIGVGLAIWFFAS